MKTKSILQIVLWIGVFIYTLTSTFAQTIIDKSALIKFAAEKTETFNLKKAEAIYYAKQNNLAVVVETDMGLMELMLIDELGKPQYYLTENVNSSATISTNLVNSGGGFGFSLDGSGMTVHEWDGGAVRASHQEYSGRVVMGDGVSTTHYHSTHVAGTMIASGVSGNAKGMAPAANLRAFDWNNDEAEMALEAANQNALVSNHSYGYGRGWVWTGTTWVWYGNTNISTTEDYLFGFYDSQAQDWDQIAFNAPGYLIVKSAGNDRGDGPSNPPYPLDGPHDCISHAGLSKNVLTVGAVNDIPGGYTQPSDVSMSSFSSWGPVDDGRIKPDIVANGVSLYSTDDDSDTDYTSLSGTSMAAPSVAGSLILLQEHYENLNGSGNFMLAATLKALVIHTADEAGSSDGPDYEYGWGLMNTLNAAQKITENQSLNVIDELALNNGDTYQRTVKALGGQPLQVTVVWTDDPGIPVAAALDPSDVMLVNDLDLRITESANTYYPWKLDKTNPSNAASQNSENNVDNVEMVTIVNPVAGTDYTIVVDHDGNLSNGSHPFSIVISGITTATPVPPEADFIGSPLALMEGQTVNFTDQSTNNPTSWSWSFPGGNPSSSTEQNPVIVYPFVGLFDVSLTTTNSAGSDTQMKIDYVEVTPYIASYCTSSGNNASTEWVETVSLGSFSNNSGSDGGYADYTTPSISVESGQTYSLTMTPGFSNKSRREFWRVWIDFNMDGDFTDGGEEVYAANGKKNTVSGNITMPSGIIGETRMRVAMKYNAAPTSCEHFNYGEVEDYKLIFGIPIPLPPVADFTGVPTSVSVGNSVQFTDLSTEDPFIWNWSFPGGTPPTSSEQNPLVTYNTLGTYSVSLIVTNDEGSDSKTITDYITVNEAGGSTYCASQSNSNELEWIAQVDIDAFSNTSGASLYSDFSNQIIPLVPGSSSAVSLTPHFVNKAQREFWRIWIDFNSDGDFEDTGEQVFTANNKRSTVIGSINIPSDASGQTRMRITMKNGGSPLPCETFSNGEVEDYTVDFGSIPSNHVRIGELEMQLFPNPAKDILHIQMSSQEEKVHIKVFNMLGTIIDDFIIESKNFQLDLSQYQSGLYYIGAANGKQLTLKKFVIN